MYQCGVWMCSWNVPRMENQSKIWTANACSCQNVLKIFTVKSVSFNCKDSGLSDEKISDHSVLWTF